MAGAIKVKGLREVDRAFREMDKEASKELRKELLEVARPVAETARGKLSRYPGASVQTVRPRAGARGAFVTQGARKVTGLRPDFGALQQRRLEESLDENERQVVEGAEHVIDVLSRRHGF